MKKPKITFSATDRFRENTCRLRRVVRQAVARTLAAEAFPYPAAVSVTFCDAEYIHALNKEYRGVDRPTDVLSFPLYDGGDFDETECAALAVLGDVVLNLDRVREQAAELGNTFEREAAFLTVHSCLHLLGYDHERSPEDEEAQCSRQREIIETVTLVKRKEREKKA